MPNYHITTIKFFGTYYWQNQWNVLAADLATAGDAAESIATFEAALLSNQCSLAQTRVNEWVGNELGPVLKIPTLIPGLRTLTLDELLPAENVARVALQANSGRDGSKALRLSLGKDDVQANGKKAVYYGGGAFETNFDDAKATFEAAMALEGFVVLIGQDPAHFHPSPAVNAGRPGWQDTEHGWFNRNNL